MMMVYTSAATQKALRQLALGLLRKLEEGDPIGPRELACLIGTVQSTADSSLAQIMTTQGIRDLQTRMLRQAGQQWDTRFICSAAHEFFARADLLRIAQIACYNGRPLLPLVPTQLIASDGSPIAAGAVLLTGAPAAAAVDPQSATPSRITLRILFSRWESAVLSQNAREVQAASLAVLAFVHQERWAYQVIGLITDSMVCRRYLMRSGQTFNLAMMARRLHDLLWEKARCRLLVLWSHGRQLYLADGHSRPEGPKTLWAMSPAAMRVIQTEVGTVTLDACATAMTRVCRKFIGPRPSPLSGGDQVGTDVLGFSPHVDTFLQTHHVWALPPRRMIGRLLVRFQEVQAPQVCLAVLNPTVNLPELAAILPWVVQPPLVISIFEGLFSAIWIPDAAVVQVRQGCLVVFRLSFTSRPSPGIERLRSFVSQRTPMANWAVATTVSGMPSQNTSRRIDVAGYLRTALRSHI
jgi:hypothetical protein